MDSNPSSRKENDQPRRRRDWLLLLLALLMSFSCVFCSTQLALLFWPDRLTPASLLTKRQADYRGGPGGSEFDLLDPLVGVQAATDAARLQITPIGAEDDAFTTIARLPATPTPTTRPGPPPMLLQPVTSTPTVAPALDPTTLTSTPNTAVTSTPGTLPTLVADPVTSTPPSTPLPANTPTLNPNPPPTSIPTLTSPAPANTPAAGFNPTNTPVPANTPTPVPTSTPLPGSTFTPTSVPTPPATSPSVPTPTNTVIPTDTPVPPTDTPVPPTDTPVPPVLTFQISGQVFEDINYAGGNGTAFDASDVGLANVRVELYDGSSVFQSFTTTNANGFYAFTVVSTGTYIIRVVSASLGDNDTPPVAGFNSASSSALAEQTYEHNGVSGNGGAGALGGNNPITDDTTTTSGGGIGDTHVAVSVSTASVTGVDFGFAYNAVVNTNDTGQGSLRRALLNANAIAGTGSVGFAIFGAAPYTIQPASALPTITDPVIIDGWSQPGWVGAPIIELDGTNAGVGISGLIIIAGSSTVRGLVINRFSSEGIFLTTNGGNLIVGNYVGADATGTIVRGNGDDGIDILSSNNIIGGTSAVDRNIISGNNDDGIHLGAGAAGNMVQGNYIGTDVTGSLDVGNTEDGMDIEVGAFKNTVGGTASGAGNVISGNGFDGINIENPGTSSNIIQGNFIGTNAAGAGAIPNSRCGIYLDLSQTSNTIGGVTAGEGNLIAYNVAAGVCIVSGAGDAILSNTILANGGLGIDLGLNGVSINNGTKDSSLPNNDMDYPIFTSAVLSGSTLTVSGYVGSAPNQSLFANARVEIFIPDNDSSGYGEGRTYLGFLMTDANGDFSGSLTVSGLSIGDRITGTATDASNNTSEFGPNVTVN